MADTSIDKIVLDAQLKQNKEKLNHLPNNPELSQEVQEALIAIGRIVNGNNDIAVSKIEQGQGEYSGYVDMEFTSKDGVSTVSLNDTEWKVKGIDGIAYNGDISDYKELNKTFDSSIIDYDRIERELSNANVSKNNVEVNIVVYPEKEVMTLEQAISESFLENINLVVSNNGEQLNVKAYSEYDQDTGENLGFSLQAWSDNGESFDKEAFENLGLNTTIEFEDKIYSQDQVLEIFKSALEKENFQEIQLNQENSIEYSPELERGYESLLDKEVALIQDSYVSNLERMGALEDFNKTGMNLPVDSLEQIKDFVEKKGYTLGEFEKESGTNTIKFDVLNPLDSNNPVMNLAIQESGKVELSQGGSTYEITGNSNEINVRLNTLDSQYSLGKDQEVDLRFTGGDTFAELNEQANPKQKDYVDVLNDASQNWHKNDLSDFSEISSSLVAEHGAKVLGNYDVSNMEINLTVHNANEQALFEIHSTKLGRDIDVVGLHSNEEFAYSKSDSMSVDLIKQQYSVESMELDRKIIDITSQKDAAEINLEKNFSNENLEKFESLQAQHDVLTQSNSIEYSPEPEQTYNLNLNYTVPSQSASDIPVETPVSTEQTVTDTPNIRNDQNAAIPEQVQQVEPNLTETTSTTTKTDIEQQATQPVANQEKGATLDKVGYEVPQSVSSDFVHTPSDSTFKPSKFYEKSNPVAVAFEDRGKSLSSSRDDNKTIAAMVAVAKSKNWNEIQVKGTEDFKRKAWLEAASQGIKVKGFKPTERDLAALEAKQEEMSRNQIHHVPQREQATTQTQVKTSQEVKTEHKPNFNEYEQAKIITARRILEDSLKKQEKSPSEMEKALKAFDQMTKHPENVQKLIAAQTKQTKEIEHQKTASQERSR